ncbi:MAG TPA: SigE family RNA polymerase sigma factor [Acidimicrobiales bacterium]|jgi:RNA polymerase sigma-70 factor (sigma-E family)
MPRPRVGTGEVSEAQEAFGEAYRTHRVRLVRVALALCGDMRTAEDAVADAVARVWPRFRDGRVDDVGAYLRRAVVNEVIGRFRRRSAEAAAYVRRGTPSDVMPAPDAADDERAVWEAVQRLPVGQRAVLVLRFLEDLSEADIASALGVSVGTVKSRSSRGLEAVRRQLQEVDVDG